MLRVVLLAAVLLWPVPQVAAAAPPAMAAVGVLSFSNKARCSATLIAEDLVLTAAHCLMAQDHRDGPIEPRGIAFRTGAYPGHDSRRFPVSDLVVHPLYIGTDDRDRDAIGYDAGLVRLESAVPAEVAIPIAVVEAELTDDPTYLASYRAGRGDRARERRCPIVDQWPEMVSLSCDVRPGESGSPILVSEASGLGLVGIVSASSRLKRTEIAFAVRAAPLLGVLKAMMGGF